MLSYAKELEFKSNCNWAAVDQLEQPKVSRSSCSIFSEKLRLATDRFLRLDRLRLQSSRISCSPVQLPVNFQSQQLDLKTLHMLIVY
jgi:hypothetical protein